MNIANKLNYYIIHKLLHYIYSARLASTLVLLSIGDLARNGYLHEFESIDIDFCPLSTESIIVN